MAVRFQARAQIVSEKPVSLRTSAIVLRIDGAGDGVTSTTNPELNRVGTHGNVSSAATTMFAHVARASAKPARDRGKSNMSDGETISLGL